MAKQEDIDKIKNSAAVFVIFGATGDLSKKRIFPALFALSQKNLLPEKFKIIACARTQFTNTVFRKVLAQTLEIIDKKAWEKFSRKIDYLPLDVAKDINLHQLAKDIEIYEKNANSCLQRVFYMAISPNIFEDAIENFAKNKLHLGCLSHKNRQQIRIIVEKPFGQDLKTAQSLNKRLLKYFLQNQIFRIDHYLGKETVQNIFAFRFANEMFEPLWSNKHIDHMQITVGEYIGVEKRGEYFDKTGTLRDMVQNHLLQLLALATMEEPQKFEASSINMQKLKILQSIKRANRDKISKNTVRGQYEGYLQEEKIEIGSQTESYALVKLSIDNERWQGVPFYLRTGKKLTGKVTSIIIQFKEKGHKLFENFWQTPMPNHITIQIQPNEGIGIRLVAKKPGLTTQIEPVDMEFCYKTSFDVPAPEAYERLLLDVILGDQSLFLSQDIIEESWKIIDPIEKAWQTGEPTLATYKPGSWGPEEADRLIEADGHQWLAPLLTICKI